MPARLENKIYHETITITAVKLEDNTTSGKYLTLDSDSDGTVLTADRTITFDVNNADRVIDLAGNLTLSGANKVATWEATTSINLRSNAEIRFYDNGNYVGFEAPALSADQIWILPTADGSANEVLRTDGSGTLSWATAAISAHAMSTHTDEDTYNISTSGSLTAGSTVTIPTALTGVIRADSGVLSVDTDVTDIVSAASTTAAGKVELAIGSEVNTGTSTTLAVTPDALDDWTGSAQITTVGTLSAGNVTAQVSAASTTAAGKVEIATGAETNTGTSATLAVSPDALDDWTGSAQVTTLGTIASGIWQGTAVANTYVAGLDQNCLTTSDPTFNDLTIDKIEANECFTFDAFQTATGDGTTTIDWGLGNLFYFTFGAQNDTFTFTAPPGSARLVLILKQDGTGSRLATWPATVLWPGNVAPTLTTTAAYVDIVTLIWDGTSYFGLFNGDFR